MYSYKLVNNHYIVEIDGQKFLIDTGSCSSFWVSHPMKEITINGEKYSLQNRPVILDVDETNRLVGVAVDGFIGMDIISKTSLTIFPEGIEFSEMSESSLEKMKSCGLLEIPMLTRRSLLMARFECGQLTGNFIIDTGAKYGYGVNELFYGQTSFNHVSDYNPSLGHLDSDIYHLDIVIGGQKKTIDVCNNQTVAATLTQMGALMIGSVFSLYSKVCSLDTKRGKLILL